MTDFIYINRHGNGNIGRFAWVNSDTRRTGSSWTLWGNWWWDTSGERPDQPTTPSGWSASDD